MRRGVSWEEQALAFHPFKSGWIIILLDDVKRRGHCAKWLEPERGEGKLRYDLAARCPGRGGIQDQPGGL